MAFAENVKRLRESKGMTQAELANMIGVTQVMIAQYERGIKTPSFIVGIDLAKTLGVTCEELAYGKKGA